MKYISKSKYTKYIMVRPFLERHCNIKYISKSKYTKYLNIKPVLEITITKT